MAASPFIVIAIEPHMIVGDEQLGTKDKFWCRVPAPPGSDLWLFKLPRREPGKAEHLAEKIAFEIGSLLGVSCAQVELALFDGTHGSASRNVVSANASLVLGNEIIAGRITGYDPKHPRRSTDHTWARICEAIRAVCGSERRHTYSACRICRTRCIGRQHRPASRELGTYSHDNLTGQRYALAPSFDHASSLGRELRDERRARVLAEGKLEGRYLRRGSGGIYLAEAGEVALAPIALVERLGPQFPNSFAPWLSRLGVVTDEAIDEILTRMPAGWITGPQEDFARAVIQVSRSLLERIAL